MSVKAILIFCAQALLIQSALSQCASRINYGGCGLNAPALTGPIASPCGADFGYSAGLGYGSGLGYGIAIEAIPTSGGGLPIFSSSAIAPSGLSVSSENVFEGTLFVTGELPFLSAVALEGVVPSAGAGAVSYSCGNGVTAIESIAPSAAAIASGAGAYGAGIGGYGYSAGGYGSRFGGIAPLSIGAGCNAPVEVISPIGGCGCGGLF